MASLAYTRDPNMRSLIVPFVVNCGAGPSITEDIGNITIALGREASLKCVVTHLLDYKVNLNWPQEHRTATP